MNSEKFEEILKKLGAQDVPAEAHEIARRVSTDFDKTITQTTEPKHYALADYITKSRLTKLVAAAVILVAILFVLPSVTNHQGIVLADVLAKVEQAHAFMYRMKMVITGAMMPQMPPGKKQMQALVTVSNDYGIKMEMTTTNLDTGQEEMKQQMYVLPDRKAIFMVMPEMKRFTRMELTNDLLARMKKQNNDPREMIKQIIGCKYTELGRSVIDGVKVEGFQTTDPAFGGGAMEDVNVTLWVDLETWLPVRTEMDLKMNEQMQLQGTIYDYQWDIPVTASEFEPVIPKDYTGFPVGGMKLPSITQNAAIEGLRFFAELSSGRYPKNLNMALLMQETVSLKDSNSPAAQQVRRQLEQAGSEEAKATKILQLMQPIQSLAMFYMTLVQDKREPVYYGESVGPDDVDAILLRWKISDDRYRVVFGDLTTKDVAAEELAELEKPLLQQ